MADCLFCKIIAGEIPSKKIYEDEFVYAFADIAPQAPFHAVVVPKTHISYTTEINADNSFLVAKVDEAIAKIAKQENLEKGFRGWRSDRRSPPFPSARPQKFSMASRLKDCLLFER